ncbi:hypothetical protein ABW21_db0208164 [Orbilia brochopaga]|nr:hypothetical protein ABW21_db0208164 [Drechslerella brochopaga]
MTSYSTQKSAIPPPSPSPYSRLPTPSNSHFGRSPASRSISTAVYGSSHPSPSRPSLPSSQASSYDSFAPQPCPSPSPSKIPGFGLQRANSTASSSHRRQTSIAEKAKVFERSDDGLMRRSQSTANAAGSGISRGIGSIRRGTPGSTPSRPTSYVDNGNDREMFSDIKSPASGLRRPSLASGGTARHQYDDEGQASTPTRKSLGLLSEASPAPMHQRETRRREDSQLMPPPPQPLIRQFSGSPTQVTLDPPVLQATIKPPSPLPQVPTPSPRKGTHTRAQSHGVALSSKSSRAGTSTRPADPRPTSTIGSKKVAAPGRPQSTVNAISAARPRAVSHNAAEARRLATPANDVPLPRGSLAAPGRTVAPPRPTSTRPSEPVASSTTSTRRPPPLISRSRPTSSHITIPITPNSARGSDTESSMRSESVASSTSNASSARSDMTTRPKQGNLSVGHKTTRDPPSPRKSSPVRGHKKNMSMAAKTSRPGFNTYKQEYQQAPPMPKPTTASLMHASTSHAASAAPSTDTLHAQTRLLQLAMLHSQSFSTTAALRDSAQTKLYNRFSQVRDKNAAVYQSYRREQELVDLQAMSLVLKKQSGSKLSAANRKNKLSGSPEEAIQVLSEELSKVLAWFTEGLYETEYTSIIRVFEHWISLPDGHERKIDGLGSDFGRDILKMRRKMEMALGGLEGWVMLVNDSEKDDGDDEDAVGLTSSLGRLLAVAVGRLKAGLEELNAIQAIERTVVTASRKDMRKTLIEVMEDRRGADIVQQKRELAAWEPVWAMPSA